MTEGIIGIIRGVLRVGAGVYCVGFLSGVLGLALRFSLAEVFLHTLDELTSSVLFMLPKFHLTVTGGSVYTSFFTMLIACIVAEWALSRLQGEHR